MDLNKLSSFVSTVHCHTNHISWTVYLKALCLSHLSAHVIWVWFNFIWGFTTDFWNGCNTYQKLFNVDIPAPRKGRLTAKPSGKFCIPIPMAKFLKKKQS